MLQQIDISVKNNWDGGSGSANNHINQPVSRGYILYLFFLLSVLSVFAGILTLFSQLLPMLFETYDLVINPVKLIYQCYGLLFSLMVIVTELDTWEWIRSSPVLQSWTFRGICYIYIGLYVIDTYLNLFAETSLMYPFIMFSGSFLCIIGILYVVMVSLTFLK